MQCKLCEMQIGKNGLTSSFISNLKNNFKKSRTVKIKVLKSARAEGKEGKKQVEKFSEEILNHLGDNYVSRVIGFTIKIVKFRKPVR